MSKFSNYCLILLILVFGQFSFGQTYLGSGSYTTLYPGADSAGRNGYPSGSPQLSKTASSKPVPIRKVYRYLIIIVVLSYIGCQTSLICKCNS